MSFGGPGFDLFGEKEMANLTEALQRRALMRFPNLARESSVESYVERAEQMLCQLHGVAHAVAMNSCSTALWAGLVAIGIGPGDTVLVPSFCYAATAAAVLYTGADIRFVDVDETLSMSLTSIDQAICSKTRAVIAVHMLGRPSNMEGLVNLCTTKGLLLVEDVAQAFGSTYLGRPLGSFGLFSVLSFNLFKTVTCGDGGALLTNDRIVFERAYSVHDHGMSSVHTDSERFGPLIGLNFRMTDLSGAVLVAQIGRLPQIRQLLLDRYQKVVEVFRATGIPLAPESEPSGNLCNVVIVTLPTAESAASLASVLGARPLCGSRAHLSWQMQLTQNRLPSMTGRVLDAVPSACPSKDFLERSVAIGIGLGDSYFGIPQIASLGEDCEGFDNSLDYLRRQLFTWRDASSGK